jgi:DNA-binding transcriptional LysR family regulator
MELRHLRYFVTVAESGSFRRAAERLFVAQPPLSRQLRQLEHELGVELLARERRGVRLTPAGESFLAEARATLAQAERARATARSAAAGDAGRVVLGVTGSALFNPLVAARVGDYRLARPAVDLVLCERSTAEQLRALRERELDVGVVRPGPGPSPPGVALHAVARERLVAAVPADHPLAGRRRLSLAALHGLPLLLPGPQLGSGLAWVIERLLGADARPDGSVASRFAPEVRQVATLVHLAASGAGIALVPDTLACLALPGVRYVSVSDAQARVDLQLAHREAERSPLVLGLVSALLGAGAEAAAGT